MNPINSHPTIMPKLEELLEVAYEKERASSRRLAKNMALSTEDALRKILQMAAGNQSLVELISSRKQQKANVATKIAHRKQMTADARAYKRNAALPDPAAWLAWFDGTSHPNPGKMGVGGMLKNPNGELTRISFAAGQGDSSEAEYLALIAVLQAALEVRPAKLVIYGDSRVVLDDVQAENGAAVLSHHRMRARQLLAQLANPALIWIPRRKNAAADALSQQAVKLLAIGGKS
ncbi:ribonuclease HI family protein [Herminiimonas sp. NPDC097707]|uniref:ribonuclease HI family protein n=1 Tax=Herminiimonas sp. NPDC097707 TaxID=3364007 RepID=UPI00383B5D7E